MTLVEKIFSDKLGKKVKPNEIVVADVDYAMGQDGTAPLAINTFRKFKDPKISNPEKIVLIIDHSAPSPSEGVSNIHTLMREFSKENKVKLYDIGEGICHQMMMEDYVLPYQIIVGSDSHTCSYGALGAFSTGIGSTDAAVVYKTGKLWFRIPETLIFETEGKLKEGVYSKDLILALIKKVGADGATYKSVEFRGNAVNEMSVEARMTLANMAVEMGAKNGITKPDEKVAEYLKEHKRQWKPVNFKDDDTGAEKINFSLDDLEPQVALPHTVDNVLPVSKVNAEVQQAFIGTCTNGRLEDLKIAAKILEGKKVKVRTIIAPASRKVYIDAIKEGLIETFINSGAVVVNPGCACCVGTHEGVPSDNESVISTANRNFKGRMGNNKSYIYLASPATVAASSLTGKITDPRNFM